MKPYSDDLREKIIKAWLKKDDSVTNIARRFDVDRATAKRYIKRYKETGEMSRKRLARSYNVKVDIQADIFLSQQVKKKPEATLEWLRDQMGKKLGIFVSTMTISRHLKKIKLTRKKKRIAQPNTRL